MRGTAAMYVGRTTGRFSMILSTRPSTAVTCPTSIWPEVSTLPNTCASGSHRYWTSSPLTSPVAAIAFAMYDQLSCGSRTPLGRPVVPEV